MANIIASFTFKTKRLLFWESENIVHYQIALPDDICKDGVYNGVAQIVNGDGRIDKNGLKCQLSNNGSNVTIVIEKELIAQCTNGILSYSGFGYKMKDGTMLKVWPGWFHGAVKYECDGN
jgi:hypothetical protein